MPDKLPIAPPPPSYMHKCACGEVVSDVCWDARRTCCLDCAREAPSPVAHTLAELTAKQIHELTAGPETDALVAEAVGMPIILVPHQSIFRHAGKILCPHEQTESGGIGRQYKPSTDRNAAGEATDWALRELGYTACETQETLDGCRVTLRWPGGPDVVSGPEWVPLPHARCLAVLLAAKALRQKP